MAGFHDALAALRGDDGALTIGDDFESSLTSAYDGDMDISSAKISQLEADLADVQAQLIQAKAANWDLLQSGKNLDGSDPDPTSDPDNAETDSDAETDDGPDDFDDLFGSDDDDNK